MAMTLVSTVTVGSGGAASIEFTNIPQTGKDLLLLVSGRADSSATGGWELSLNNVTSSNYNQRRLVGNGSTATSDTKADTAFQININASTYTANTFGLGHWYISNYTSTTNKSVSADYVSENNSTTAFAIIDAGSFTTSSAITQLKLFKAGVNFVQHSTASLYIISQEKNGNPCKSSN